MRLRRSGRKKKKYDTGFVKDFLHCIDAREVKVARVTRKEVRSKNKDKKICQSKLRDLLNITLHGESPYIILLSIKNV